MLNAQYRDAKHIDTEKVTMTRNVTGSSLNDFRFTEDVEVEEIQERFKELDDTQIIAAKVVFEVLKPRKRKYSREEFYYRVVAQ